MKIRSYEATVSMLETFFESTLDNLVTVESIYKSWGRQTDDPIKNKAWLASCLVHLKHHDLAYPIKERRNNRNSTVGLRLSNKGKKTLGRSKDLNSPSINSMKPLSTTKNTKIDHETMMNLVAQFKKDNPMYEVVFEIKLKD
ncbi:MAG: hypothetical protein HN846_04715 [Candidatus Pacebacteria bacterium]|jgi:hypothetical protein|nr:hypothetical protein [Candidatus Paceibacterota bacterium]MBT3511740.1 hypothetical protein [Candidatus Paceibacterota bacterium]MBT4004805.1 hypothetical protein [Candidatus Paceibacterota bacterium]MBT4358488.1 hypothetical protein [Candidatus Paceibacterota bacterium]MBT4680616.1 hypothetical protein [Candidatus Paceibacterota bacterium]